MSDSMDYLPCRQVDPDIFFPVVGGDPRAPKALCKGTIAPDAEPCPILAQCLEWGMTPTGYGDLPAGVWGGMTLLERRNLRARRLAS